MKIKNKDCIANSEDMMKKSVSNNYNIARQQFDRMLKNSIQKYFQQKSTGFVQPRQKPINVIFLQQICFRYFDDQSFNFQTKYYIQSMIVFAEHLFQTKEKFYVWQDMNKKPKISRKIYLLFNQMKIQTNYYHIQQKISISNYRFLSFNSISLLFNQLKTNFNLAIALPHSFNFSTELYSFYQHLPILSLCSPFDPFLIHFLYLVIIIFYYASITSYIIILYSYIYIQKLFQMQKNQAHQPERFEVYTELPNGTGFKISGSEHIFYYDRNGGWKDEYGNYYNSDGQPDQEPDSNSEKSVSEGNWSSSEEDQFQKEFGPKTDIQQEFQKQKTKTQQILLTIAKNVSELEHHPSKGPLRVNFEILDLQKDEALPTRKDLVQSYNKKVKGVINAFYDVVDDVDQNTGYFVVSSADQAHNLVQLEGQNIVGHDITFDVETFDELKTDPLTENELENNFLSKYVDLSKDQKLYTLSFQNGDGFTCQKKQFMDWWKGLKFKKEKMIKMVKVVKNDKQQRKPIVKLSQDDVKTILGSQFEAKKLNLIEYVPRSQQQQQQAEKKQGVKEEEVEGAKKQETQTTEAPKTE